MSYEKHEWVNNEVITAEKLNNLEDGVSSSAVVDVYFQGSDDTAECNLTFDELKAAYNAGALLQMWYIESSNLGPTGFRNIKHLLTYDVTEVVTAPALPEVSFAASLHTLHIQYNSNGLTISENA